MSTLAIVFQGITAAGVLVMAWAGWEQRKQRKEQRASS